MPNGAGSARLPRFSDAEVDGLDEPVQRYFRAAITPGTPLFTAARLTMRGRIKVGRWIPFQATELLAPRTGFLWHGAAAGIIWGSDRYLAGVGGMQWRLGGIVPVMRADGPDVSKSAAGRAGAEGLWVPTALLPRFGVEWEAHSGDEIIGRFAIDDVPVELHHRIDRSGALTEVWFQRWGDPTGGDDFGWHRFGGPVRSSRSFAGVTVPSEGSIGWNPGTHLWPEGEFFRYHLTSVRPLIPR